MRFLLLILLVWTSSFCMYNSPDKREEARQLTLERESVEDVVAQIASTPVERTERDDSLHCGDKQCCDCWQTSVQCLLPCAHDTEGRCKLTADERCCFYKAGSTVCCALACLCTWGWATQGCPPWTAPH